MRFSKHHIGLAWIVLALSAALVQCSDSSNKSVTDTSSGQGEDTSSDGSGGDTGEDTGEEQGTDSDTGNEPGDDTESDTIDDTEFTPGGDATGEVCGNEVDDDADGYMDCADSECVGDATCLAVDEICDDCVDNDLDGRVDCVDPDCDNQINCQEDCVNGIDDDGDTLTDCADPTCAGIHPACGEVCGDLVDNDGDGAVDCADDDCAAALNCLALPDGGVGDGGTLTSGMICAYNGEEPHLCECADGIDNDTDNVIDSNDLHCFGPFDDDEFSYATGLPGDNNGAKGNIECPFDGNSGTGNDGVCCNPADPTTNVTPNGCDDQACCEIDVNGNTSGEFVYVMDQCVFAPACGEEGTHGCPCDTAGDCDEGQFCVMDRNTGPGFCSTCEPCISNEVCANPCDCGEFCFGGFTRPPEECGGSDQDTDPDLDGGVDTDSDATDTNPDTDTNTVPEEELCDNGLLACPNGETDCPFGENCVAGCCYPQCEDGVIPCEAPDDCPQGYTCITGCCIVFGPVV